jgi:putative transposase
MINERFGLSERRACQITGQHRSTQRHQPGDDADRDDALREQLRRLSAEHPRWGYRLAWGAVRAEGWAVNRKKIQRLWREEGLRVPQRKRKRQRLGESTVPAKRLRAERPNHVWALDFQFDTTSDGRTLKLLHVVDEYTREALAMRVARSIDADHTTRVLDQVVRERGAGPELVRMDIHAE